MARHKKITIPEIPVIKEKRFKGYCTWTPTQLKSFIDKSKCFNLKSLRYKLLDLGMYKQQVDPERLHNEYISLNDDERTETFIRYTLPYLNLQDDIKLPPHANPRRLHHIIKAYKFHRINAVTSNENDNIVIDVENDRQYQYWNDINEDFNPMLYIDGWIINCYDENDITLNTNKHIYELEKGSKRIGYVIVEGIYQIINEDWVHPEKNMFLKVTAVEVDNSDSDDIDDDNPDSDSNVDIDNDTADDNN